jgi:prolipoprotein diacylglyceryltransferase
VPGAVLGGRIGDALAHPEAYAALPSTLLDPSIGGLELGLGVAGGVATATYVGVLLGAPVARWARLLAGPVLLAIGAGKLTMALGGSGQGLPLDAAWATAYLGPGPWGSAAPDLPSHPSQLYEGIGTLVLGVVTLALVSGTAWAVPRRDGRVLLYALAAWAVLRAVVSLSWRDAPILGPLPAAGLLAAAIALGAVATLAAIVAWRSTRGTRTRRAEPSWPEPETRPPF